MNGDDLLLMAFNLSILTYDLGVVLYSLPIPIKSLKRWGINLIIDGISTSVLISCFTLMLSLTNVLQNLLNADWSTYFTWIGGRVAMIFSALSALTYVSGLLKNPYISLLSSPIGIVAGYLSAALSALRLLTFLGSFILNYHRHLVVLGIVLYSLPMRLGKNAGAYLIAMSLVLYVGLPLMPVFVESFQSSVADHGLDSPSIYGYVIDLSGEVVPNAVLNLYRDNELVGKILINEQGRFTLGNGYDLLPKEFNYDVKLELYGIVFTTMPEIISSEMCSKSVCSLNLTVPGMLTAAHGRLLILQPTNAVVNMVRVGSNEVSFTLSVNYDNVSSKLLIAHPKGTTIQSILIDGEVSQCYSNVDFDWYGIQVSVCELLVVNAAAQVSIIYKSMYVERPSVDEKRIIAVENMNTILANSISLGISLIFSLVFLPSLYMTLLLSISASLAKFLGGRGVPIKLQ
ncbi:MAG: carboxypeptidase-like regulatory domain-containing protein [Sulfolobales archaeon]|nr:carboxypeptidase-like regulatory domain-containing protein [Sulfolobales archaeon]MCX8185581.1 carboxypeptidase-like regulatory domain-containing protein [Sulfolobales archaeon]MDW7969524.1 carboxypeptidase-like regulatory domain-containing protein [Sulfolobales archaeon]